MSESHLRDYQLETQHSRGMGADREQELVSVIIPTYNRVQYVADALDSVWAQSYRPLEVIVVDDGSTDNTEAVVSGWIEAHQTDGFCATYHYQDNAGAPAARNHGLRETTGDWIKFLDSDDILHRDCIERQVKTSAQLSPNQIVFGDLGVMDATGKSRRAEYYEPPAEDENTFEYLIGHVVNTPTSLHRRLLLERVNGFREDVQKGQEYDLHLRLAMAGVEFVYERGVVAYKRQAEGDDSVTSSNSVEKNPEAHIFIQDNRRDLARSYYNGDIPERVCHMLAKGYWMVGRQMTRAGYLDRAEYCFQQAHVFAPDARSHMVGPRPYQWLAQGLGGIPAENVLSTIKRLIGR